MFPRARLAAMVLSLIHISGRYAVSGANRDDGNSSRAVYGYELVWEGTVRNLS